ncbi:MAG: alanine--tRNA ligase [Simkaniaceae bacterium]|nr:alanine--tRNA ligase [Simkaniaceae bacterium]MCF7852747.1 alanine--tRNA ligase [Simkaniaceae bacterium]
MQSSPYSSKEIRRQFIQYFEKKGHLHLPSSPVFPHDDPTLLFTNAGMNQFKDIFLGRTKMDYKRAVTSQKCIRVGGKHNDLDNVGHTSRHMTFFEMLGNFSFGDYFKKEAIQFAFDVTTEVFQLDIEKIWVTIFEDDDEAYELWKAHMPEQRIVRMGAKDNFWMMGEVGPCGPCSELYFDRGEKYGSAKSPADPDGDLRYLEFWNLVFMQFNRSASGHQAPLPNQSIDTGAGLERIMALKMGVDSVFETDILQALIRQIEHQSGEQYTPGSPLAPAFHVIADHLRALSFAIADGVQPSNLDRGYVLRKILRRATRYAKRLGFDRPFLADLVPTLITTMGDDFPELKQSESRIAEILTTEEESFLRTLKRGGNILNQIIDKATSSNEKQITGEEAFKLKDTYGFPLEEILLIAKDTGLEVNIEAFEMLEHKAKELSKKAHVSHQQIAENNLFEVFTAKHGTSTFVGYRDLNCEASIIGLVRDGQFVDKLEEGQQGEMILDTTPFYAEKGGQVGDQGLLSHHKACFEVRHCTSPFPGVISHSGVVTKGAFIVGEPLVAQVNEKRRKAIAAHHTATHLLHKALYDQLGEHIRQSGSLVESNRLRFDFTHHKALTPDEIRSLEMAVNQKINADALVTTREINYADAQKDPSIKQFFGDKYGAQVRVVEIGDGGGKELCGGTHVEHIGLIGLFCITKETSIGAGIRRIEACVGAPAIDFMFEQEAILERLAKQLDTPLPKLEVKFNSLLEEMDLLKSEIKQLKKEKIHSLLSMLCEKTTLIHNTPYIFEKVEIDPKELGTIASLLMEKTQAGAIFLAAESEGRCQLVLKLNAGLVEQGEKAGDIIKKGAIHVKGSGGGKPDMAQAGGQEPEGIPLAIEAIHDHFKNR